MLRILALVFAAVASSSAFAAECSNATVDVCFRPGPMKCIDRIVHAIDAAKNSVVVQAYGFTSIPIIQSIGNAKKRGLEVRVVLDKDNLQISKNGKRRYTGATYLANAGVAVRIDEKVAIAHNKIIVVDRELVVGGSYNFTRGAEEKNAENVTFVRNRCVADQFIRNFERRWAASTPFLNR